MVYSLFGILDTLLSGGLSLIGGIVNSVTSRKAQREANAANLEMLKYQTAENLAQWERENEYNKPVNALNRLREAGVNPALINGSTVDAGTASPMRVGRATMQPLPGVDLGLTQAAQLALISSQVDLNNAKARKENASAGNDEWKLQFNEDTKALQVALMESKKDNTEANTERTLAAIRQVDEQLAQNHIKIGIYANLSSEQMLSIAQAREFQRKEFDLKQWQVGEQIKIAWQNADTSRLSAESMALRNACLNEMTAEQVGLLHEQITNAVIDGNGQLLKNEAQAIDNYWASRGVKLGAGFNALAGMAVTSLDAAVNMKSNVTGIMTDAAVSRDSYNPKSKPKQVYQVVYPTKKRK